MWTQWIYVQMPGQDLEYYQIEPDPKHPPERGQVMCNACFASSGC